MPRRFLTCLAFATFCFANTWVEFAEGGGAYFARYDPLYSVAVPMLCWELVLTAAMLAVWEIFRRQPQTVVRRLRPVFLACCLAPAGILAIALLRITPVPILGTLRSPFFWPGVLIAAVVPLWIAARRLRSATRITCQGLFYSWPILLLVLVQAGRATLWKYPHSAYSDQPLAAPLSAAPARVRVVWIIFDELSQSIAFENRPAGLDLPNFDLLKRESFFATAAFAPGDSTEKSMPALTIGEPVLEATPDGPGNLLLQTSPQSPPFAWCSVPNVFDAARGLGFNTALVGWFHPYGRLLNRSLTECSWSPGWLTSGIEERMHPQSLAGAMWDRARLQLAVMPLLGHMPGVFPGIYQRKEKLQRFSVLLNQARHTVADPSIGLALIHLPVPHPPAIYNRSGHEMTPSGRIGYLDSVALADVTLGELRDKIRQAGLSDRTAILVSADHGWRTRIWRGTPEWTPEEEAASHTGTTGVPFLLKLPGRDSALTYSRPLNTVVTRKLITAILAGTLTGASQVPDLVR